MDLGIKKYILYLERNYFTSINQGDLERDSSKFVLFIFLQTRN
jgi:hypothetical protein